LGESQETFPLKFLEHHTVILLLSTRYTNWSPYCSRSRSRSRSWRASYRSWKMCIKISSVSSDLETIECTNRSRTNISKLFPDNAIDSCQSSISNEEIQGILSEP
jgi:hypothetical protein